MEEQATMQDPTQATEQDPKQLTPQETKQDIITSLYALRGGLSLLSEMHDEAFEVKECIDKIEGGRYGSYRNKEKYWHYNGRIHDLNKEKEKISENTAKKKQEYEAGIETCKNIIHEATKEQKKARAAIKKHEHEKKKEQVPIFLFLAFLGATIGWSTKIIKSDMVALPSYAVPVCVFLFITTIVLFFVMISKIEDIKWSQNQIKKTTDLLQKNSDIIQDSNETLEKLEEEQDSYFEQLDEEEAEALEKIEAEIVSLQNEATLAKKQLQNIKSRFDVAIQAIREQFGSLLDERDWGNVDLIIFNYETGRALDMRDALIQVDNERRNERLVNAIEEASRAICASIGRGFGALQSALSQKLDQLDRNILGFSGQMSQLATHTAQQTKVLGEKLGEIAISASAQQALLAKMNTSSNQMAKDMTTMQELATQTYYNV